MKGVIFDLDDTIFDTKECKPYLRTHAGREVICDKIISGKVKVSEKYEGIVNYINSLIEDDIDVFIFSDSPKNYCLTLIDKFGIMIHEDDVFGSQHKPCVENHNFFSNYDEMVVIGDSAKDIFFAHIHGFSSILLARISSSAYKFYAKWTKPTSFCADLYELEHAMIRFFNGKLPFVKHDFASNHDLVNLEKLAIIEIPNERIGYSFEYWSNPKEWDDIDERKNVWFEVQRSIKVAKDLSDYQIEQKQGVSFYNKSGTISDGKPFKTIMWVYYLKFIEWANSLGLTGNVYLVPIPPSAPIECNETFTMNVLVKKWSTYARHYRKDKKIQFSLINCYVVDRFWPTPSAHLLGGRREIEPHLNTMAVFKNIDKIKDASAVIIIDDIITSGTQMNAVATILTYSKIFPKNTPIYGYALAKTTHLEEEDDDDLWF